MPKLIGNNLIYILNSGALCQRIFENYSELIIVSSIMPGSITRTFHGSDETIVGVSIRGNSCYYVA